MDQNESIRKFEQMMMREADHAQESAIELGAPAALLPSEKYRGLAHLQIKTRHHQAKEFRELARKVKEN